MITELEKISAIKLLKLFFVEKRKYEYAAILRDMEKSISPDCDKVSRPYKENISNINIDQYKYCMEILDSFTEDVFLINEIKGRIKSTSIQSIRDNQLKILYDNN